MSGSKIITVPPPDLRQQPNVELRKPDFDALVETKGYRVIQEKTVKCPCGGHDHSPLLNCKNCNGSGWIGLERYETKMLIQSINVDTRYKEWTEEKMGNVQISARYETSLSFMDRIQIIDQTSSISELLFVFMNESGTLSSFPIYNPIKIDGLFLFVDPSLPLTKLQEGVDYVVDKTVGRIDFLKLTDINSKLSLRYDYYPLYYVIDINHEIRSSYSLNHYGREEKKFLPCAGIGRRAHYLLERVRDIKGEIDNT